MTMSRDSFERWKRRAGLSLTTKKSSRVPAGDRVWRQGARGPAMEGEGEGEAMLGGDARPTRISLPVLMGLIDAFLDLSLHHRVTEGGEAPLSTVGRGATKGRGKKTHPKCVVH